LISRGIKTMNEVSFFMGARKKLNYALDFVDYRGKHDSTDIRFADFDGVLFHVSNHGGDKTKIKVMICYQIFTM